MEYLPLFLLMLAALIAGWFYLQKAKNRDAAKPAVSTSPSDTDTSATPDPE